MTVQLSRRGLFLGLRNQPDAATAPDAVRLVAHMSDRCVEPKGVVCRRCGDECEARAIAFRPLGGGRARALIDAEICTGCTACLPVCPTQAIEMIARERGALMAGLGELGRKP